MEVHSIFKYTIERNGIHFIPHDKIEQFKKDPLYMDDEINEKLKADAYGLLPIFIINPNKIKFYDSKNKKTNKITRRIYNGKKKDE